MRFCVLIGLLLAIAGCSSGAPGAARLTLNDPYWDHVNVEFVITKSDNCSNRGPGYISTKKVEMYKDTTFSIDVPEGANLCWRHDRDPGNPSPGAWSGWTKATLFPGQSAETDL
jgi:hypothetical protein